MSLKILLTAATAFEIKPLLSRLSFAKASTDSVFEYSLNGIKIDVLVTGVGIMTAAYHLGRLLLREKYRMAIQAGICGSYLPALTAGEVLEIVEESITDLGADEETGFRSVFDLGLMNPDQHPFTGGILIQPGLIRSEILKRLPKAKGATVSSIPGRVKMNHGRLPAYVPETESMEGAAFFYSCLREGIPFTELRAVSNRVEERDKSKWEVTPAVNNLNNILFEFLSEQTTEKPGF